MLIELFNSIRVWPKIDAINEVEYESVSVVSKLYYIGGNMISQ